MNVGYVLVLLVVHHHSLRRMRRGCRAGLPGMMRRIRVHERGQHESVGWRQRQALVRVPGMRAVRIVMRTMLLLMMMRRRKHRRVVRLVRVGMGVVVVQPARSRAPKRRREVGRAGRRIRSAVRHVMNRCGLSRIALGRMAVGAHREMRCRWWSTGDRHGQVRIVVKVRASASAGSGGAPRRVEGRRLTVRDRRALSIVPERVEVVVRVQRTVLERFMYGRRRVAAAPVDALLVRMVSLPMTIVPRKPRQQ